MATYAQRLTRVIAARQTPALVGIDPRFELLPEPVLKAVRDRGVASKSFEVAAIEEFGLRLIDVVAPLVPAVKPQIAFFEQYGPPGLAVVDRLIRYARTCGLVVIADAKRNDIGSTAQAYATAWLAGENPDAAPFAADALTVSPYLGLDTLQPFAETATRRGAGIYVLARTSNAGAGTVQDHCDAEGNAVFRSTAIEIERLSLELAENSEYGPVGAVVGATWPDELVALRKIMPHAPLLIPGYGSQGGSAADVAGAFDATGHGAVVNSSRGINFSFRREPYASEFGENRWEEAVHQATLAMIDDLAKHTNAGALRTT